MPSLVEWRESFMTLAGLDLFRRGAGRENNCASARARGALMLIDESFLGSRRRRFMPRLVCVRVLQAANGARGRGRERLLGFTDT